MRAPPSRFLHALALATHLGLIALLIAWSRSTLGLAVALLLFAPLPGLVRGRPYTFAWASMLISVYCAMLLAEGYARPEARGWAFGLAGLAALEFVALILFVRLRARELRAV